MLRKAVPIDETAQIVFRFRKNRISEAERIPFTVVQGNEIEVFPDPGNGYTLQGKGRIVLVLYHDLIVHLFL